MILAWRSAEYIEQGAPLRFTTASVRGTNKTSEINGYVTAILISNTDINGVRTLVSELHIVADQASTVNCTSETTTSVASAMLNIAGK